MLINCIKVGSARGMAGPGRRGVGGECSGRCGGGTRLFEAVMMTCARLAKLYEDIGL